MHNGHVEYLIYWNKPYKEVLVHKSLLLVLALIIISYSEPEKSAGNFTDAGSKWFSGSFGMSMVSVPEGSGGLFNFGTDISFRYFPVKYFVFGPKVGWNCNIMQSSDLEEIDAVNALQLGAEAGAAFTKSTMSIIPYILIGGAFDIFILRDEQTIYEDSTEINRSSTGTGVLSVSPGIVLKPGKNLGVQLQPGMDVKFRNGVVLTKIRFGIGFNITSGKVGVSTLSNISFL